MRLLVSSGEVSGDQRLQEILDSMRALQPLETWGLGPCADHALLARGDISMMGVSNLHRVWRHLLRARTKLVQRAEAGDLDGAILVDYSGFHIRLGNALRKRGLPVVYYVPPKLWAWGGWRVRRLRTAADLLVTTFPFEDNWFRARGFHTLFRGHPAQDAFVDLPEKTRVRQELGLPIEARLLLLMPGSRPGEIAAHMQIMAEALARDEITRSIEGVIVPVAQKRFQAEIKHALRDSCVPVYFTGRAGPRVYAASDRAWIASGTANLEAAWAGIPAAVFYKTDPLTWAIGQRVVQVDWLSPVNLVAEYELYPEFLQHECTADNLLQWLSSDNATKQLPVLQEKFVPAEPILPELAQEITAWLT